MAEQAAAQKETEGQEQSGGLIKTLLMGVAMFVIVLAAQTVAPLISARLGLAPPVIVQGDPSGESGQAQTRAAADTPPIYWPLKPPMIVNFAGDGESAFLQVEMEVMARDQAVIDQVKEHMPALRNSLLLLLASQTDESVFSTQGKQELLGKALTEINSVLGPYTDGLQVEAVYFTSFVAQ